MKTKDLLKLHIQNQARLNLPLRAALSVTKRVVVERCQELCLPITREGLYKLMKSKGNVHKTYAVKDDRDGKLVISGVSGGMQPLAKRAWVLLDQIDVILSRNTKGETEMLGGACFALGVMVTDFISVSSGRSENPMNAELRKNAMKARNILLGRNPAEEPSSGEIRVHLESNGIKVTQSKGAWRKLYNEWVKKELPCEVA